MSQLMTTILTFKARAKKYNANKFMGCIFLKSNVLFFKFSVNAKYSSSISPFSKLAE